MTQPTAQKYAKACQELRRIGDTQSPREKVKHCQIMYTYLKTIIYEESKGSKGSDGLRQSCSTWKTYCQC